MPEPLNKPPNYSFHIQRGAPQAIIFRIKDMEGVYRVFDSSLKFQVAYRQGLINKTVGAGITLSTYASVPNAEVTIQLTEAESRLLSEGGLNHYEIEENLGSYPRPVLEGRLVASGGFNTDA